MRDPDVMMVVMINHCANPAGVVEFTKCVCVCVCVCVLSLIHI